MDQPTKRRVRQIGVRTSRKLARVSVEPAKLAPTEEKTASGMGLPPEVKSLMPSAALIGIGLLLESELLVGIAIGTGMVIAAQWLPEEVGKTVKPMINGTVKACYSAAAKTSAMVGDAVEQVESIVMRRGQSGEESGARSEDEHAEQGQPPA